MRRLVPVLLALLATSSPVRAERIELPAVRDNTLFEDADGDTSNGSGSGIFCGRNSQGRIRRAVIAFAAPVLPAGVVLDSVRLELHMSSSSDAAERILEIRRVLAPWGEGASASAGGGGAPAQPGDATWLHTFYPTVFWTTAGGDLGPGALASLVADGSEGDRAWRSPALAGEVSAWLLAPAGTFDLAVIGDESVSNTARRFESRESATAANHPRLVLYLSLPDPVAETSWGQLKSRYRR